MSEVNVGVVGFEEVVVTSDKKFKPRAEFNNLCLGSLVSVEIKETTTPKIDDKGIASTYEYAGIPVPTLVFRYKEAHTAEDEVDRYYSDSYRIVTTKKSDGSAVDAKTFSSILMETYRHCRHRLDAYKGCANFEEPGFPKPIDMNATINDRIEAWRSFCQFFVNAFNKGKEGKPVFINEDGSDILVWMKLIAHYPDRKYLSVPGFVGEGYVERYTEGKKPSIEIKPGETIVLAEGADDDKKDSKAATAAVSMGYGDAPAGMTAEAVNALQEKYAGGKY
ncbi:MAG: hypothetical protein HDQ88_04785 [Clostridia bacterium]|nr:hypothetical protein [Clostridia bacterium]